MADYQFKMYAQKEIPQDRTGRGGCFQPLRKTGTISADSQEEAKAIIEQNLYAHCPPSQGWKDHEFSVTGTVPQPQFDPRITFD